METKYEVQVLKPNGIIGFVSSAIDFMTMDKTQAGIFPSYFAARKIANAFEAKHAFKTRVVPHIPNSRDDLAAAAGNSPPCFERPRDNHKHRR
jgi:hypothetical protein